MSEKVYRIKEIGEEDAFFERKDEFRLIDRKVKVLHMEKEKKGWCSAGVKLRGIRQPFYFSKVKLEEVT